MIDRTRFEENFKYFDKNMISEIIEMFIREQPERFAKLQKNVDDKDFEELAFNTHSLKSVLSSFMDPVALDLAKTLEEDARNKNEENLPELLSRLREATALLIGELNGIHDKLST